MCKIVGLILFKSAHLVLAKKAEKEGTDRAELSRLLLASGGFWEVIGW